jgi:hypothetical protein
MRTVSRRRSTSAGTVAGWTARWPPAVFGSAVRTLSKPLAGIELAMVRLRSGALDAAVIAPEPALSLSACAADQRRDDQARGGAGRAGGAGLPVVGAGAGAGGERIEEFGRETIVAGLRSLPGGPG